MSRPLIPPFVRVTWLDAEDLPETWSNPEDAIAYADSECVIVSFGYVIKKSEKYLVIAADLAISSDGSRMYGRITKIPTDWVKKVVRLKRY